MEQEFATLPREVVEQALEALSNTGTQRGKQPSQFLAEGLSINALRAALEQPQNHIPGVRNMAPAGWKLVPVEPTKEMLDAYVRLQVRFNSARSDWAAMLAAAPQPPAPGCKATKRGDHVVCDDCKSAWDANDKNPQACVPAPPAVDKPQANQPAMTPIAQRKLDSLLAEGYTISGYSVYHDRKHQHGFVTGAGLVGWWKPEGVEYPQPLGEQEPVAWMVTSEMQDGTRSTYPMIGRFKDVQDCCDFGEPVPLIYQHPQPKREPLTDERIDAIADAMPGGLEGFMKGWGWRQFARAVLEATNNIK